MSTEEFETFMRSTKSNLSEFTWAKDMFPKISDVVWRSLKSV